ncbi:MAG: hypothetical protein JSR59_10495 [Proteobacteria bacterium]|nr:hypothetical protein [Pseudomonadota bacterium]
MKTYCLTLAAALASALITLALFQDVARLADSAPAPHAARIVNRTLPTHVIGTAWLDA